MKRLLAIFICLVIAASPALGASAASNLTVTLSNKGEQLYDGTLSSLEERINVNGYAQTSLDGSYDGMYSRDAAIQAMALTANGNYKDSKRIMEYLYQFHRLKGARYVYTRMGEISAEYTDNNFSSSFTSGEAFESYSQTAHDKIVAEIGNDQYLACQFVAATDVMRAISIFLNGSFYEFTVTLAEKSESTGNFNILDFVTVKENTTLTDWYTFTFSRDINLKVAKEYYLILSAVAHEQKKVEVLGTAGTAENYYYNKTLYGDKWVQTTDIPALKTYAKEALDDSYSVEFLDFTQGVGGTKKVIQQIPSNGQQFSEVIINIEKSSSEITEPLYVSLYSDINCTDLIEKVTVPADEVYTYATYKIVPFSFLNTRVPEYYYLCLSSDSESIYSYYWKGTTAALGHTTYSVQDGQVTNYDAEMSYFFAKMNVSSLSTGSGIQTDATFFVLHAFANWYLNNPDTEEKNKFANRVWGTFSSYADYFLTDTYFSKELNLLYNPQFEHIKRNYSCYDLVTNVFASQALYEMAMVAEKLEKTDKAAKYKEYAELIATGINTNLVTDHNGKKIYAEMKLKEGTLSKGFSFINLAPAGAEWFAVDDSILLNTYEAYLDKGTIAIGEYKLTDAEYILTTSTSSGYTLGKNIAWELMCVLKYGDSARANQLLSFLDKYNEKIYAEKWSANGAGKDIGNQEQCSWLIYALVKMFPALTKYQVAEAPDSDYTVDITPGTQTVVQEEDEQAISTGVLIAVMIAALLLILGCVLYVIISRRSGMRAYAKAIAAKRHRERIVNQEFSIGEDLEDNFETTDDGFSIKNIFGDEE